MKKEYTIMQMPLSDDRKFMPYSFVEKHEKKLSVKDYVVVYRGKIGANEELEDIYVKLNSDTKNRPKDYFAHSLSVSDIVFLEGKYYYVDTIGFVELETERNSLNLVKKRCGCCDYDYNY